MFKIGDFSKICQVPVSALRYYADIGLLEPAHVDSATGYRFYDLDQLPQLNRILALKDLGLSLTQIRQALNDQINIDEMRGMLRLRESELEQELSDIQARLTRVRSRINIIEHGNAPPEQEIIIKQIDAQPVLSIREIIPTGQYLEYLIRESAEVIMSKSIDLSGAPLTIVHDSEFKEVDLDVEVAYPLAKRNEQSYPLADDRRLSFRELEAVPTVASVMHIGSYYALTETYASLGQWIIANNYEIVGRPREIYLRAPENDQPPLTEIQMPIERK